MPDLPGNNVEDTLRRHIDLRREVESLRTIATAVDMDDSQLSRFQQGKRSITLTTASRLCTYLGLVLKPARRRKTLTDEEVLDRLPIMLPPGITQKQQDALINMIRNNG